jgi:hypothetical protein
VATTEPSNTQPLESTQVEYAKRQLKELTDLLRRYCNSAEQEVVPALLNPEQADAAAFWAKLSGQLHAGLALALCRADTILWYLEEGDVPGGHDHLPTSEDPRNPE